jgi:L1 cell adhesion molecule like protein
VKRSKKTTPKRVLDGVYDYAKDTLVLGLLLMEFNDSIREGDGDRIIRCWKFLLPLFKSTGRTKYSVEAVTLLAQYYYLFSPRMAAQMAWSRTINTHGRTGKNISCDLHLEHLNRVAKNALGGLQSNVTEKSVERIGKTVGGMSNLSRRFDVHNNVPTPSDYHTRKPKQKDVRMMVDQLRWSLSFALQKFFKQSLDGWTHNKVDYVSVMQLSLH